jgi:Raf kinase inhibitor-like YbhB/YbcL family protein
MELTSPSFKANEPIPDGYTFHGIGASPPLRISGVPDGVNSLALIMHDPDAPNGDFIHWIVWNISATATILTAGHVPHGALQGLNDYGKHGYGVPAPPSGTHRYVFDLYALNSELDLPQATSAAQLLEAIKGHEVTTAQLVGTVTH